ncbi:4Fe-4S dicluster domain-containing protein [Escherichia coli]
MVTALPGCPFNIPRLNKEDNRVYKCTLCVDRVSGRPGTGLCENLPDRALSTSARKKEMLDAGGTSAWRS